VPLVPRAEAKGQERKFSLLIRLCGMGERRELSQRGPGEAPTENGFIVI